METYYVNEDSFKNSIAFKNYLNDNSATGFLKIRAYSANEAIPIKGLEITITKEIESANVIFFKGLTNESGIIENIVLPAPKLNNNIEAPIGTKYTIMAKYNNETKYYNITMYDNIHVVQNINIVPMISTGGY